MPSNGNKSNKLFNMRGGGNGWNAFLMCSFCLYIVGYTTFGIIYEVKKKNYKKKIEELKDTLINDGSSNTKTINTEYAKYGKGKQWRDYYDECGSKVGCIFENTDIRKKVDNLDTTYKWIARWGWVGLLISAFIGCIIEATG
jgi:hypothetical protein